MRTIIIVTFRRSRCYTSPVRLGRQETPDPGLWTPAPRPDRYHSRPNRPTSRESGTILRPADTDAVGTKLVWPVRLFDTLKGRPVEAVSMTGEHGDTEDADGIWARTTAPQSEFTTRQVGIGFLVLALGLLITVVVPFLLG